MQTTNGLVPNTAAVLATSKLLFLTWPSPVDNTSASYFDEGKQHVTAPIVNEFLTHVILLSLNTTSYRQPLSKVSRIVS
ncbi:hypothetical protein HPB47_001094 [Ixodes persulcatus]|uniref:Uncharacterized protein n=1 Tax=Ixodes persulcatus TaxID=34615 RepID=A0AC60PRH5_IXOPE|nr:hypothetical protein HPB47_001094 [Ixodes persulcatus]